VSACSDAMLPYERDVYRDYAWWPLREMLVCGEVLLPVDLAGLLEPVIRGEVARIPLQGN
jgi:hypothetical protein